MKITFIGHASILVEAGGISILSDPWWRGPCFGAQWWTYPPPDLAALEACRLDYIYISHGHHDHFHPGTMATLDKGAKVLIARDSDLAAPIRELGFEVIEVGATELCKLAPGVDCRIMPTYGDDSLMAISDGKEVCININDALHSAPSPVQVEFLARLKGLYPKIDYVFCGYGTASHFPNCYVVPGKDRKATAQRRQQYFNSQWTAIVEGLNPVFGFPFAADVALLEDDLLWTNEPVHNGERPTANHQRAYPASAVKVVDIAPGFMIEDAVITANVLRQPLDEAQLRTACAEQIERANRYGAVEQPAVDEVLGLLRENLLVSLPYLQTYPSNYRFLIRFRNSQRGITVVKQGNAISLACVAGEAIDSADYTLTYTVRLQYLKWSLTRPYGDEIMFVGSGGVFAYQRRADAENNAHRELILILKKSTVAPKPRYGNDSRLIFLAKQSVKRLLRRRSSDLYDLKEWTEYGNAADR